jgi:hypothetical protein
MQAPDFLKAGIKHMQDRAATYDKPEGERSMSATVAAFNAVTGDGVMNTEERGWLFMQLLKAVRSQQGEFRADSYEDGASYSGLAGEAAYKERGPGKNMQSGNDGEHYGDEMQLGHMLTKHALLRGDWWCADTSEPARQAFALRGFRTADQWGLEGLDGCRLTDGGSRVARFDGMSKTKGLREIALIDGEFYYCKSQPPTAP